MLCELPWLLASPRGKAAALLLQQESLSGCELSLPVAGGQQLGCHKIKVPVWTPPCSCHHVTGSWAKAFSLPAPKPPWLLSLQRHRTPTSVSPGWHRSSLVCLAVASQGWKTWHGRREPARNGSLRSNPAAVAAPHTFLRASSSPCVGSKEVRRARGVPCVCLWPRWKARMSDRNPVHQPQHLSWVNPSLPAPCSARALGSHLSLWSSSDAGMPPGVCAVSPFCSPRVGLGRAAGAQEGQDPQRCSEPSPVLAGVSIPNTGLSTALAAVPGAH